LVFRGGAIGDFVLTLPAIGLLRRRWPGSYIEIVGYPHIAQLASATGLADKVTSLDRADTARFFSMSPAFPGEQEAYIRSFDLVITYLYDPFGTVKANLVAAGARQVIYCSPRVRHGHAVDHFTKALRELAIYAEGTERPRLAFDTGHRARGRTRVTTAGDAVVAVHPGSGSPKKNWPLAKFVSLAERMPAQTGWKPMFVIGEADTELGEALSRDSSPFPVLTGCSLLELAEALTACAGYVGNDSGVTHIAAALGIPVVALYGPTDPETWGPRGINVSIIRGRQPTQDGLEAVDVEDVLAGLEEIIGTGNGKLS